MKNDKLYIFNELKEIYNNCQNFKLINVVNYPSEKNNSIGYNLHHIKELNYLDLFKDETNLKNFSIQFMDDGVIYMYYEFDDEDNLILHNLHYLPNPYTDEESDIFNLYKSYNLNDILSKYLRIDYDIPSYKPFYHGKVHLHIGLNKNSIRLPFDTWISPIQFLKFVSVYVYKEQIEISSLNKSPNLLTKKEMEEAYLITKCNF